MTTSHITDITSVFWRYVATLAQLKYDKLEKTHIFDIICNYEAEHETSFAFTFDNTYFIQTNIVSLMYDVLEHLESHYINEYVEEIELLRIALRKVNATTESCNLVQQLSSMSLCGSPTITML